MITNALFTVTRFASALGWIEATLLHRDSFNGHLTTWSFIDASTKTG
jgi:hypothetical protein